MQWLDGAGDAPTGPSCALDVADDAALDMSEGKGPLSYARIAAVSGLHKTEVIRAERSAKHKLATCTRPVDWVEDDDDV